MFIRRLEQVIILIKRGKRADGMLSVFYGLITKNNNMELKDLEEMFKMEQELDIPHKDRWYNKDFDKRELEAEQPVKNCNIPCVSNSVCAICGKSAFKSDNLCFEHLVCNAPKPPKQTDC